MNRGVVASYRVVFQSTLPGKERHEYWSFPDG